MPAADRSPAPAGPTRCHVLPASATRPDGRITAELEIRRSRFLAVLGRVKTEPQAREMIDELRRSHHDARHVCSAFILGPERRTMRSNDDGEPSGTAGVPMLEALSLRETEPGVRDLTDVCAVVVRWFGGVKLGAGGLVRAYSDAVSTALESAPLVCREQMAVLELEAPHAEAGRWENELRAAGHTVLETAYGPTGAVLSVGVTDRPELRDAFAAQVAELTVGAVEPRLRRTEWVDRP